MWTTPPLTGYRFELILSAFADARGRVKGDNRASVDDADLFALVPVSMFRVWRVGPPRSSGLCCEHACQIR
jgi:hypothetical protein